MIIAATGDVHYPNYSDSFWNSLQKIQKMDLFLLAGDMCSAFNPGQYQFIVKFLEKRGVNCPVIGVFGNTEFEQDEPSIRKLCENKIVFLNDDMLMLEVDGKRVGIVGTRGCLDQPTPWQQQHIKDVKKTYDERFEKVSGLMRQMMSLKPDISILLMHYAPTTLTLKGEMPYAYSGLSYVKFEELIKETKPTLVVHAHAHKGMPFMKLDMTPVYNVSLPTNRHIVEIDPSKEPKHGLSAFV